LGALGFVFAQARRNLAQVRLMMKLLVFLGSISLKQENFRLGKTHSRSSEMIFAQASL